MILFVINTEIQALMGEDNVLQTASTGLSALGIINPAFGVAGALLGGVSSAIERNKMKAALRQQKADNENDYKADYYADYTKRTDVQSALGRMRDQMKENMSTRRNTAAVMGQTPEAQVAGQKADNQALGNTISTVSAQAASHKDSIRNRYLQQKSYLNAQQVAGFQDQSNQWMNFASNAANFAVKSGSQPSQSNGAITNATELPNKVDPKTTWQTMTTV